MSLQYQQECFANGTLQVSIMNPRSDRSLETHASDTRPVTTLSKVVKAFTNDVTGQKKCDVVFATQLYVPGAMYRMCDHNVEKHVQTHGQKKMFNAVLLIVTLPVTFYATRARCSKSAPPSPAAMSTIVSSVPQPGAGTNLNSFAEPSCTTTLSSNRIGTSGR